MAAPAGQMDAIRGFTLEGLGSARAVFYQSGRLVHGPIFGAQPASVLSYLGVSEWAQTLLNDESPSEAQDTLGLGSAATVSVDELAPPGFIYGLTLSNNATDATNDIDIAAGSAAPDPS